MRWTHAAVAAIAAVVSLALLSGGSPADPRTPAALPGLPPPFLGTAVTGDGGLTAGVDAYGDVVDLRPGPAGRALIDNPSARQAAGSVPADTGIVPRVSIDSGAAMPMWRADSVAQRYLPGTNVVRTVARFGRVRVAMTDAASGEELARVVRVRAPAGLTARASMGIDVEDGARCEQTEQSATLTLTCRAGTGGRAARAPGGAIGAAAAADRRWLARARPLGPGAPGWADRMYRRSLLVLHVVTNRRTGAVAAGARDGWAYVWPRDAGTAALAFASAGYRGEARRVARFLIGLDLGAAARFDGGGAPVPGRGPQGDAAGWLAVGARAAGLEPPAIHGAWRDRPDYQEGPPGNYLANAIAATADVSEVGPRIDGENSDTPSGSGRKRVAEGIAGRFGSADGLVRSAGDPSSGLDSAAAWAVRPFALPALYPEVRKTLLHLARAQTRFGIMPGEGWPGGLDPWSAPTAWTAWSLAALSDAERDPRAAQVDRRAALRLLGDLRRAATPAGDLPERVGARTGVPRSTTPLAWSHAFAILALRQLWP